MLPSETFIKSSSRDDLNIQSSFTSSFRSRSSKLPREQNSVTMANTPQSWKKPRKGLTFSWRMSFICSTFYFFYDLWFYSSFIYSIYLIVVEVSHTSSNTSLVFGLMLLNVPSGSLLSHAQSPCHKKPAVNQEWNKQRTNSNFAMRRPS